MNTTLLLVSVASLSVTSAFAQTDSARELKQLAEQRDASVAAAIAPINRKYTDSLKMLLGKATRAGDLDTALKVRTELEKYGVKVARNGDTKDESSHSPELRAALLATTWSWSENPDKKGVELTWKSDGKVNHRELNGTWKITGKREVTITQGNKKCVLQFSSTLDTFNTSWDGRQVFGKRWE